MEEFFRSVLEVSIALVLGVAVFVIVVELIAAITY